MFLVTKRRLIGKDQQIVFVFNESEHTVHAVLSVDVHYPVWHVIQWSDDHKVSFWMNVNKVMLHNTFAPRAVWVVSLETQ